MSQETIRCFIAVDIGNQVIDQILAVQKVLEDTGADVKLVEVRNIHITLKFLGEILISLVNKIGDELKTVQFKSFEVSLHRVGVFPDLRRINVVWVGIGKGLLELGNLYSQVESRLKRLGISPDKRGFSPHLTVARVKSNRNKRQVVETVTALQNQEFRVFSVDSIKLKRSQLSPQGPTYTTITEVRSKQ